MGNKRDLQFAEFASSVPEWVVKSAQASASNMPLFVPFALRQALPEEQLGAAIELALTERPEAKCAHLAAKEAIATTKQLGLDGSGDAALVVAVCRSLYGPDFISLPWARELAKEGWSADELVALLRLRLALDHQRFV